MWRLLVPVIAIAIAAPFVPGVLQTYVDSRQAEESARQSAEDENESGERIYKIQVGRDGHYVTDGKLNGRTVTMLVDTGASALALPESVAKKIGVFPKPSDYTVPVSTANGVAKAARATVREMKLGSIRLRDVDAIILKDDLLSITLLGMSALGKLDKFHFSNDTLILVQ